MVLDEDALEAMLRRQKEGGGKSQPVELTHETEEFEVYERPKDESEVEEAPEEPVRAPMADPLPPAFHEDPEPEPTPEPEPRPVPEPAPKPTHIPVPDPVIHGQIAEPSADESPEPTPPPAVTPRTHAPEPTPHNFAPEPAPSQPGEGPRLVLVQALFNEELTEMMAELAKQKARKLGAEVVHHVTVPGVYDLPLLTQHLLSRDDVDGAVVIGVVVQGETKHDELITHATARTLQQISLETGKPIGLGITGPGMTWAQAEARVANGAHAVEAAVAQVRALAQH